MSGAIPTGNRANFNFNSYLRHGSSSLPTVEVRLAAGTFDANWVVAWTSICASILQYAKDRTDADVIRLLKLLDDKEFTILPFLEAIGLRLIPLWVTVSNRLIEVKVNGWYDSDIYNNLKDIHNKDVKVYDETAATNAKPAPPRSARPGDLWGRLELPSPPDSL